MTVFHIECDVECDASGWNEELFQRGFEAWLNDDEGHDWPAPADNIVSNVRITMSDG